MYRRFVMSLLFLGAAFPMSEDKVVDYSHKWGTTSKDVLCEVQQKKDRVQSILIKGLGLTPNDYENIQEMSKDTPYLQYIDATDNTKLFIGENADIRKFSEQIHGKHLKGLIIDSYMLSDKNDRRYCDFLNALRYRGKGVDLVGEYLKHKGDFNKMERGDVVKSVAQNFKISSKDFSEENNQNEEGNQQK